VGEDLDGLVKKKRNTGCLPARGKDGFEQGEEATFKEEVGRPGYRLGVHTHCTDVYRQPTPYQSMLADAVAGTSQCSRSAMLLSAHGRRNEWEGQRVTNEAQSGLCSALRKEENGGRSRRQWQKMVEE
jgi:hypothetical protein